MDFAIHTGHLGRIYKIRGGKKSEPKELVALRDVSVSGGRDSSLKAGRTAVTEAVAGM